MDCHQGSLLRRNLNGQASEKVVLNEVVGYHCGLLHRNMNGQVSEKVVLY